VIQRSIKGRDLFLLIDLPPAIPTVPLADKEKTIATNILTISETIDSLRIRRKAVSNTSASGQLRKRKICGHPSATVTRVAAFERALEVFKWVEIPYRRDQQTAA